MFCWPFALLELGGLPPDPIMFIRWPCIIPLKPPVLDMIFWVVEGALLPKLVPIILFFWAAALELAAVEPATPYEPLFYPSIGDWDLILFLEGAELGFWEFAPRCFINSYPPRPCYCWWPTVMVPLIRLLWGCARPRAYGEGPFPEPTKFLLRPCVLGLAGLF